VHVALLNPPATDPRAPTLALPSLAAFLRAAGVRVTVRDLGIEGLLHLLEPGVHAAALARCERRLARRGGQHDSARLRQVLSAAELLGDCPDRFVDDLRDATAFFDPWRHWSARQAITVALQVAGAAVGAVWYDINPVAYEVGGVDPSRLSDLARVTADDRLNPFADHWAEHVLPALAADRPDVVGVSILTSTQIIPGLTLARRLRAAGHTVVIGGTVYAKFEPQLRERPEFFHLFSDGVVPYEGETALLALVHALADGRDPAGGPNLLWLSDDRVAAGPVHLEDVTRLPTPDFDGLPLSNYLAPAPVLPLLTGKGCYFNQCRFCDIPFINRVSPRAYRVRAADQVAADVAELATRHGTRYFELTDEALSPALLLRLADALEDHHAVDPRFVGFARLEAGFTPATCERLYAMGLRKLFFGLESGSQATLDHMKKGIRIDTARDVIKSCAGAGIAVHLFSIIGFPEETEVQARETLQFFLDSAGVLAYPGNSFDVHPFSLDLRTPYFDDAGHYGVSVDDIKLARRDFPISADAWCNARGMGAADVSRLIVEFRTALRRAFPDHRCHPFHLWPGMEEYAVLYADEYAERAFPFRLTLPPQGDPTRFCLVWAETARIDQVTQGFRVRSVTGEAIVAPAIVPLLAATLAPMPVDELLDVLGAPLRAEDAEREVVAAKLRGVIEALLALGVLWLVPRRPGAAVAGGKAVPMAVPVASSS
jgi:anaerobic magnesium-protoporphyrin IX monomethyl ester cyclase